HAVLAAAALDRGVHVLVEKPGALSLAEAEDLRARAAGAGRLLWVGLNRRYLPSFRGLKERLDAGTESPRWIQSEFCLAVERWQPLGRFLGDPARGGGVLHDVVSHQVDLLAWLVERPIRVVRAVSWSKGSAGGETLDFEVRFEGGLTAAGKAGHTPYYRESIEVEAGGSRMLAQPNVLVEGRPASSTGLRRRAAAAAWANRKLIRFGLHRDDMAVSFLREWQAFARAVRGEPASGRPADAETLVRLHRALEALARSNRLGGEWCDVEVGGTMAMTRARSAE
ncbi:MAG: Gfo/Idh/MocA family protein, partial [Anaerolineales bacterium]